MRQKPLPRTKELVEHFAKATGDRPTIEYSFAGIPQLGVGPCDFVGFHEAWADDNDEVGPPALEDKYGEFTIVVYEDEAELAELVRQRRPARRGVHWSVTAAERGPEAGIPYASCFKVYGRDLRLDWARDDALKETDERWDRLDRVLTDFVARDA
jgi:hypothetical protein